MLEALHYGEIYWVYSSKPWLRAKGIVEIRERTGWGEQARPVDVTGTMLRLRKLRLVKVYSEAAGAKIIVLTPKGVAIVEEACTVSP